MPTTNVADGAPANQLPSYQTVLKNRLSDLRSELRAVRGQISDDMLQFRRNKDVTELAEAEQLLDDAHVALETRPPDQTNATNAATKIKEADAKITAMCRAISLRTKMWTMLTGGWAVVVLVLAAILCSIVWNATTTAPTIDIWPLRQSASGGAANTGPKTKQTNSPAAKTQTAAEVEGERLAQKDKWLALRAVLIAALAGILGAALDLGHTLYLTIQSRTFEIRRVMWYFIAPLFSGALAAAIYVLVRGGTQGVGVGNGNASSIGAGSSAAVWALGFLVGFVPNTIYYRINKIVQTIFGTDEVKAPQVAPPELKRDGNTVMVTTKITPSAATRLVSVTGVVQSPTGTSAFGLSSVSNYAYTGTFAWPEHLDDPNKGADMAAVIIEARDETGNVGRSQQVSLSQLAQPTRENGNNSDANNGGDSSVHEGGEGGAEDTTSTSPGKAFASSTPEDAGTLDANKPIVVRFSKSVKSADTTLLSSSSASSPSLNQTITGDGQEITLSPASGTFPAGDYTLAVKNVTLADDTKTGDDFTIAFTVSAP